MKPNNFPVRSTLDGTEEIYTQTNDVSEKFTLDDVKAFIGKGLEGKNYILVTANGTAVENAAELESAYTQAISLSPSATNRFTIVAAPGYYDFGSSAFKMNTQYIDLVSLDGNRSIIFNSANTAGTISITANNVYVKGVDVETKNFTIGNNLYNLKIENCKGGDNSFGATLTINGTSNFTNCEGGNNSFAGGIMGTAGGTFVDCTGGHNSFGCGGFASGYFKNCIGKDSSFGGGLTGSATGTFVDCKGTISSFGGLTTASGNFTNCEGTMNSFGGGAGTASGNFTNCIGDSFSFGGGGTASGIFTNCTGGTASFGGASGINCIASGTFINCKATSGSFGGGIASGTFINCIGAEYCFGAAFTSGTASGSFTYCIAGDVSFGKNASGTLTGKLYHCRLTTGTFQTVSGGGRTIYCIDGSNNTNNQ